MGNILETSTHISLKFLLNFWILYLVFLALRCSIFGPPFKLFLLVARSDRRTTNTPNHGDEVAIGISGLRTYSFKITLVSWNRRKRKCREERCQNQPSTRPALLQLVKTHWKPRATSALKPRVSVDERFQDL